MNPPHTLNSRAPIYGASPWVAIKRFWGGYAMVRGRASRSEFWWWSLINLIVYLLLNGLLLRVVSPSSSIDIQTGAFGPGFVHSMNVLTANFADHPAPVPVALTVVLAIWSVVTLVPSVTLLVRRLHDANFSGLWAILGLVPTLGLIPVVLTFRGSQPRGSRFDRLPAGVVSPDLRV